MKLFQDFNTPYNIVGDTDRTVEDSLKQCLKQIVDKRWLDTSDKRAGHETSDITGRNSKSKASKLDTKNSSDSSGKSSSN